MSLETIHLRIDEVTKRTIETAARLSGKSLAAFIVNAARSHANQIETSPADDSRGAALAAYYRAKRFKSLERQNWNHLHPGYLPVDSVANKLDWDMDESEWLVEVDQLLIGLEGNGEEFAVPVVKTSETTDGNGAEPIPLGIRRNERVETSDVFLFNPLPGRVINVGAAGLGIETRDALAISHQDQFSIGDDSLVRAKLRAEVRWCRLARTESRSNGDVVSVYRSGVEFLEAS